MLDLLCIGEAMSELRQSPDGAFKQGFAGDTYNTAVYAARKLGKGRVGFCSRVGTDPMSRAFKDLVASEDLNPDFLIQNSDKNIGIYSVSTDPNGERSFHYWRNQSAARELFKDPDDFAKLPQARVVYLSGISMAILSAEARQNLMDHLRALKGRCLVAYDSNYRPALWESKKIAQDVNQAMWDLADIGLPSIDDEMDLFEDESEDAVIARFSSKSWTACAIKRGERGPVSPTFENPTSFAPVINVVDTTAAGDSFNAGYLSAFLDGSSEEDALLSGHALASVVVTMPGAITPR